MWKSAFVIAVVAACSSVAFAAEVKQGKTPAPAVKAQTMNDADMDKVTAGAGIGHAYAFGQQDGKGWQATDFVGNGKALGHLK
jgi:hypothetical protein